MKFKHVINFKRMFVALLLITIMFVLMGVSCEDNSDKVDSKIADRQEQRMKDKDNKVGDPNIKNWTDAKMANEVVELRDKANVVTYAYTQNISTGKYVYVGQCIGFPLPYTTQISNPEKHYYESNHEDYNLPQAEPNGLFTGQTSATWIRVVDPTTGKSSISYCEPNVVVFQFKKPKEQCESWSLPSDY